MKKAPNTKKLTKLKRRVHRHVKLTFVPHGANQYRPHLIRRYGLVALFLLVIGAQAGYNLSTSGSVLGAKTTVTTSELVEATNEERTAYGIAPLRIDEKLSLAAFLKAQDMLEHQYWAHVAPDGTTPWQWVTAAEYNYASAGENLAKNFTSSDAAVAAWMASPDHRKNLLNAKYKDVGFAVANGKLDGEPATLIVALYGESADAAVAGTQTETAAPTAALGPLVRAGIALQSMTPAAIGSMFALLMVAGVALLSHFYRGKLPLRLRKTWYRHHGLVKVGGMLSLVVVMIVLYSGGQI